MFETIDENQDHHLSSAELKALIIGIHFEEIDLDHDDAVSKLLKDFDTSNDGHIQLEEFERGITKWLNEARQSGVRSSDASPHTFKYLDDFHKVRFG